MVCLGECERAPPLLVDLLLLLQPVCLEPLLFNLLLDVNGKPTLPHNFFFVGL